MLKTIREYALERLRASADEQTARLRHLEYFLALVSENENELRGHFTGHYLTA